MGTNGQAMLSASSSADGAGEGGGALGGFPFVVLSGGQVADGEAVNPAFAAYARRSVTPGRTAREALALALAEAGDVEASGGAGHDTARVDEASYGVTRSPFASVTAPAAAQKAEVKSEATRTSTTPAQESAKKDGASRRRPALRTGDVSAPPMPSAPAAPAAPATSVPAPAPTPAPSTEPFPSVSASSGPAAGKLKVSLRRDAPPAATKPTTPPPTPPPDAPFLFGPVMDGSRSPLVPLPVASGAPGGAFVAPAHVATRSPFPSAGAASASVASGAMAVRSGGKPAADGVGKGAAAVRTAERHGPGGRRVAVVAGVLVVLGLVVYLGYQSPYWPFRLKQVAVAGAIAPTDGAETSSAETAPVRAVPPASASVQVVAHPTRPAPSAGFVGMLEGLRITGVMQGEPVRAIIGGRLVQAGDLVDVTREVRLVGLDVAGRQLIFEDRTTARASVRY